MLEIFKLFAVYNAEMNARIYSAAQRLSHAELCRDRGAYFVSIIGTMNHLIVADTLWLQRLAGHPANFPSLRGILELPKPDALNQIIFTDLAQWHQRRVMLDQMILHMCNEITEADLVSILHYHRTDGTPGSKRLQDVLQHFFNHQTHHRGQISTLLFQAGVDVGVTDLLTLVPDPH